MRSRVDPPQGQLNPAATRGYRPANPQRPDQSGGGASGRYCALVYTDSVDERPVVWDRWNRRHIIQERSDRDLTTEEIEEAMSDPARIEIHRPEHESYELLGRTRRQRWLIVAWVDDPKGRYPVHVHEVGERALRRWMRRWRQ